MPDDPRVQLLLEELLASNATPEEVCSSCIELLPVVADRWRQVVRTRDELNAIFPPEEEASSGRDGSGLDAAAFPEIAGYEIEAVLGSGGMGVVFKARHLRLNRVVALKMALAGAYAGAHERERFQREAQSVAALRHPNVVQIHEVGDSCGRPYFTMEYVEGGSLAAKLSGTPLQARDAASLLAALADAVHAAHRQGIIHRDLKPGNVLLAVDGAPRISDFGLARRLGGEAGLTRTGVCLGTPSYMAPEQAQGAAGAVGPLADVYSLGAILYETLTGRPPFRAESAAETVHQLLTQDPVPPSRLNGKVPRDLETICMKCLSKEPSERYAAADALRNDLCRFLDGESIAARPEGRMRRAMRAVRRRPALAVGTIAGLAFTALILAAGLWFLFDKAVLDKAVAGDLEEIDALLKKSSYADARTAIERAVARLGARRAPLLRRQLNERARDCELVDRLERINIDSAVVVNGVINLTQTEKGYDEAFLEFGLGRNGDDPQAVALLVRNSRVRNALLAALDCWSAAAREPARAEWAMKVADEAEPDRTPWRQDARNPRVRGDRSSLVGLIGRARVEDESAALLLSLSSLLIRNHHLPPPPSQRRAVSKSMLEDSRHQIPFLTRIQRAHPDDLWANYFLGVALLMGNQPDEAIRYFQAVAALRPDLMLGYHHLGLALNSPYSSRPASRHDEAVEQFRKALKIDPKSAKSHLFLVVALEAAGRHDEAIEHAYVALRYKYQLATIRATLGASLTAKGRGAEALVEFRRAFALEPEDQYVQDRYRAALLAGRRWTELRPVWAKALEADRPNHSDWYGYAELCLYLGQEKEYLLARKALLARFGKAETTHVAERTARACLLLPASREEMRIAGSLAELASRADRKKSGVNYPYYQFPKGLADYRQGRVDQAIAVMRGESSAMSGPLPSLVLAMALHQAGKRPEARKTFASAMLNYDWRESHVANQDGWICHVLRREAEKLIFPNLTAMLDGTQQPRDADERTAMIGVCRFENRLAALARIYSEAFAADPNLAEAHRVAAARAAAQAGCGRGKDAGLLGEAQRAALRAQARKWIRDEASAQAAALGRDFKRNGDNVKKSLKAIQNDAELRCIRDSAELEKAAADEREDCRALWARVDVVIALAAGPARESKQPRR